MRSSLFRKLFISVLGIFLFLLVVQWAVIGRFFKEIYLKSIVASQRAELSTAISRFSEADENYGLRQHALDTGSYIMVLRSDYTFGDQQFMDRMGSVSLSLEDSSIMVSTASFGSYPYQPSFLRGEKACVTAMQLGCSNYYEPLIVTTGGTSYTNLDAVHDYKNQAGSNGASTHEINGVGIVAPSQNFAFGANGKKDANFFLHQRMLPCLLYRLPIDETLAELTRRLIPSEDGVEYMVYSEARMVGNTLCYFITARQIILTGQEQIYFDRMLYIVYAILGVLLIIAAWLLSRYLSWPLVQLSEATRSLSHLDFSHQVSIRRNDELGLLSDSINDMADSLSEALRELRAANDRARNNEVRMQKLLADLAHAHVLVHGDETVRAIAQASLPEGHAELSQFFADATEEDWGKEYLSLEISIHVVCGGVEEAIAHINRYGTNHSECIMATDESAIKLFQQRVDAAAVYANASTRFTDGGEFGLGAEIGISTQKLHVRGPFALEALTSTKYLVDGTGQVRE